MKYKIKELLGYDLTHLAQHQADHADSMTIFDIYHADLTPVVMIIRDDDFWLIQCAMMFSCVFQCSVCVHPRLKSREFR